MRINKPFSPPAALYPSDAREKNAGPHFMAAPARRSAADSTWKSGEEAEAFQEVTKMRGATWRAP